MAVDDVKLQQKQQQEKTSVNLTSQLLDSMDKSSSESQHSDSIENNNRIKKEEVKTPPPSPSSFIDINNLPMVFDDSKLFQNVSNCSK
jgi:hypothetical protein